MEVRVQLDHARPELRQYACLFPRKMVIERRVCLPGSAVSIFFEYFPTFAGKLLAIPRLHRASFKVVDRTGGIAFCGAALGRLATFAISFAQFRSSFSSPVRIHMIVKEFPFLLSVLIAS